MSGSDETSSSPRRISGCGKAARLAPPAEGETARLKPKLRLIPQQSAACLIVPIKAAPLAGNIHQESGTLPQPWRWLKR